MMSSTMKRIPHLEPRDHREQAHKHAEAQVRLKPDVESWLPTGGEMK